MEEEDEGHGYFGSYHYQTSEASTYGLLRRNAKSNRRYPTEAEALLWERLKSKQLGIRFRRQHPVYGYIPDFVCLSLNIVIEIDGGYHTSAAQQQADAERTHYLESFGFRVVRFTNDQVLHDIDKVIETIKQTMTNQSAPTPQGTPLLRRGRGRSKIK